MTKDQKLAVIWRTTHRDYKGKHNGTKCVLVLRGGTCLVPLSDLTDAEIESKMPSYIVDTGKFARTSKKKYWEMLEVLPPAIMTARGGFLVGEAMDHNAAGQPRFAGFLEYPVGVFYESKQPMTVDEFKQAVAK